MVERLVQQVSTWTVLLISSPFVDTSNINRWLLVKLTWKSPLHECMCVCMIYVCEYVCMGVCEYVCMGVCVYVCM